MMMASYVGTRGTAVTTDVRGPASSSATIAAAGPPAPHAGDHVVQVGRRWAPGEVAIKRPAAGDEHRRIARAAFHDGGRKVTPRNSLHRRHDFEVREAPSGAHVIGRL